MAMGLLQAGVDRAVIALWLGHELGGNHTDLPRSESRDERGDLGEDNTARGEA